VIESASANIASLAAAVSPAIIQLTNAVTLIEKPVRLKATWPRYRSSRPVMVPPEGFPAPSKVKPEPEKVSHSSPMTTT
jgi:hypothetical protein